MDSALPGDLSLTVYARISGTQAGVDDRRDGRSTKDERFVDRRGYWSASNSCDSRGMKSFEFHFSSRYVRRIRSCRCVHN